MPPAHIRVIAHAQRRRLRRQVRPVQPRVRGRQGGDGPRPPGQDLPHPRGGLLLPPRPPSGADEVPHRREEGRQASTGDAPADAARRRRLRLATASASTFYTGALKTVTYDIPRYRFAACRTFTNKPPCGPKRGHGTPQPRFGQEVQLDKIADQARHRPRRAAAAAWSRQPDSLTANYLRIGTIGLARVHPTRWSRARAGSDKHRASCPHGPRRGPRLLVVHVRRRPADLLERPAALGRAAAARPQRPGHRLLRRDRDRPGLGRRARGAASRRCWASTPSTSAASPATPTSRRSTSARYSSRVTLMMGNAAHPGRRARARAARRGRRRARSTCRPTGSVFAEGRVFDAEDPEHGDDASRGGRARRGGVRHPRHGRLVHAAGPPRPLQGRAASARRRPTATPPPWSRPRSIPRPAGIHVPQDLDRATTSAARSTRCSRAGR